MDQNLVLWELSIGISIDVTRAYIICGGNSLYIPVYTTIFCGNMVLCMATLSCTKLYNLNCKTVNPKQSLSADGINLSATGIHCTFVGLLGFRKCSTASVTNSRRQPICEQSLKCPERSRNTEQVSSTYFHLSTQLLCTYTIKADLILALS